jgi:pseudouridine-5'-phosphate glycosidase
LIEVSSELRSALDDGGPVVALETTLVAHGFPPGDGLEVALESERLVWDGGGIPATIGVLDGRVRVGLSEAELGRFTEDARKVGPRDVAACVAQKAVGATTVGGTLAVCRAVGIRFMGTGGIGGVHRGALDVSADLPELARARTLVVSSGVKSLLDVTATVEVLEALGVPTLGFRTHELPRFYSALGGPPVSARVETAEEAAGIARAHWELGRGGLLLANPPAESLDDLEPLIERALAEAEADEIQGGEVTPFVLSYLHRASDGRTLEANRRLIVDNARLAAEVASSYS